MFNGQGCSLDHRVARVFRDHVLRRFLSTDVREIRIFSRDEKKQEDMRIALNDDKLKFYIGDVRNYDSIHQAIKGVHYVFHAAALKQVPSCEFYPLEAVRTNVLGAENVMSRGDREWRRAGRLLSTDKAVYPINAMGLSKALMEKLMVAKVADAERGRNGALRDSLRKRDGLARFGDSAVRRADQGASRSRSPIRT